MYACISKSELTLEEATMQMIKKAYFLMSCCLYIELHNFGNRRKLSSNARTLSKNFSLLNN